jgi:UDP-N-acetylmuramyl pentapeptide phosphotransferase/UDP-N-acetylglucosamine-1-phosphate transferase
MIIFVISWTLLSRNNQGRKILIIVLFLFIILGIPSGIDSYNKLIVKYQGTIRIIPSIFYILFSFIPVGIVLLYRSKFMIEFFEAKMKGVDPVIEDE